MHVWTVLTRAILYVANWMNSTNAEADNPVQLDLQQGLADRS